MATQLELTQRPFIELQIEALTQENKIKPKRVEKFISELEARLLATKDLNYHKLLNRAFRLPLIGRPNSLSDDYPRDFKFEPPNKLHVLGGFKTGTALTRTQCVDLAVEMPSNCIGQKDVKNHRYHNKRALYLAQIAHLMNGSIGLGLIDKLEFCYFKGDLYKPILQVTPMSKKLKESTIFQIFIVPSAEEFNIKLSMLQPKRGNIAPKWFFKDYNFSSLEENPELSVFKQGDSDICSTPFYNSSILFDAEAIENSEIITGHIRDNTSLSEALILCKIWLYKRELHDHFSFLISMFIAYLQTRQKIHQNMSSYQIFKVIIKSLIEYDWSIDGLSYLDDHNEELKEFKSFFPVIFLSPSGKLNLCYNISIDTYRRLRHEATISHNILNATCPDVFELLFLKKVEFNNKFDVIVHLPKCTKKIPDNLDYAKWLLDHGVLTPQVHSGNIMQLIEKSMTDRVELAQQDPRQLLLNKKWSLKGIPYDPSFEEQTYTFGLLLNAERSLRIIDIGPDAQTEEAVEYQKFWDPKSQLRMQNGIISETVVWHVESFSQRRSIIKYILDHALKKAHIQTITAHHNQFEKFISLSNVFFTWKDDIDQNTAPKSVQSQSTNGKRKRAGNYDTKPRGKPIGTGEEVFLRISSIYNNLNRLLRGIESMKHSIASIQPTSHHLRASGVFPPLPVKLQVRNKSLKRHKGVTMLPENFNEIGKVLYIEPIEILVTLDSTSKWPNEHDLFEAEKLETLIYMGEKLREKDYTIRFTEDYLDILYGQFVFRIRVTCQKEGSIAGKDGGRLLSQKRKLETEIKPRVHGSLDQLYREKPAYSLTCRLVKRWISCHLMSDHIDDIAIDLITAQLFLHPEPLTEPANATCGFKRFLQLISEHDWSTSSLIVNLDNKLKIDEIRNLQSRVQNNLSTTSDRSKLPAIILCTPFDGDLLSPWTRQNPSHETLNLLRKICTQGCKYMIDKILLNNVINMDDCRALFRPNFKFYNIIIKMKNDTIQTYFMSIDPPKDFCLSSGESMESRPSAIRVMPIVNLHALEEFVNLLREKFDNLAWFFFDRYGQRLIGVILKPESRKLLAGKLDKFVQDIKQLGADLIDDVTLRREMEVNE